MLLDMLKIPEKKVNRIELPTYLIIRSSTLSLNDRAG